MTKLYMDPASGVMATYTDLEPGIAGNQQTLTEMRAQVLEHYLDPRVSYAVSHILEKAGAPGGDRQAEARALFDFLASVVRYQRTPTNTDTTYDPTILLSRIEKDGFGAGNCNNHATLMATLGHSVRLPIVWVLLGASPDAYSHVYAAMDLRAGATGTLDDPLGFPTSADDLLALDTGTPSPRFGVHPPAPVAWITPSLEAV